MFSNEDFDDKIKDQEWLDHCAETHVRDSDGIDGAGLEEWDEKWYREECKLNARAYAWLAQKVEGGNRNFDRVEWKMILGALRERQTRFAAEAAQLEE